MVCNLARADAPCRSVEVSFRPTAELQIAVWIEDSAGHYVDTAYVTRLTGTFGLANRPGDHLFKTALRYPYGRRDMVLPVWAHARDHHYGRVVMGGWGGNSIAVCARTGQSFPWVSGGDCDDQTIGYHAGVSSLDPFYCSPRGGLLQTVGGVDVVSCASSFTSAKGAYADPPAFSLYPPRADLTTVWKGHDSPDSGRYNADNDLGAISAATPPRDRVIDPPITWTPPADGEYVAKIELSLESDFNLYHDHPAVHDEYPELDPFGHELFGQPSVVYAVPFTVGPDLAVASTRAYAGYGDWDGASGTLHPPDMTISDAPGTGAGRLFDNSDGDGSWRVRVRVLPTCGGMSHCLAPEAPTIAGVTPEATSLTLAFASAPRGSPAVRFDLRYRQSAPITDGDFVNASPWSTPPPPPGAPGSMASALLFGLKPAQDYSIAVRALSACGTPSPIAVAQVTTPAQKFVVLHGCFLATAAWGSPLGPELAALRRFRDRRLLATPLGRLVVATYYTFSPPLARAIASDDRLRAAARRLLSPLAALAAYSALSAGDDAR